MSPARLTRRDFLAMTASAAIVRARPAGARPNFVFVLIDDLGWADVGCNGSRFYETPNIDRLAAGGMRFTNAYAAAPVCSPTRASILTGKYPARLHLTDWIPGRQSEGAHPGEKMLGPRFAGALPLEEVTIAEALKQAGYATGYIGKWHLGGEAFYPDHQGFDVNVGGTFAGSPASYFPPYKNPKLADGASGEYLSDRLTDEAIAFIEAHRREPFFLYLAHYAVHIPLQAKEDLARKYREKAATLPAGTPRFGKQAGVETRVVQDHAVYAAMIQGVDESVGRLVATLERLGLASNTCVIFMSDNGGLSTAEGSPTANVPLRAGKGWLYEGGIREPMVVRWPGVVHTGRCDGPVISTDFYPTMLDLAGLPLRPQQHVDGVSLAAVLRGARSSPALGRRPALYWHYPHYSNQGGTPSGAIRSGRDKLIEYFDDGRVELYDLSDDVGETRDLSRVLPDKAGRLRATLHEWRTSIGADMPRPTTGA